MPSDYPYFPEDFNMHYEDLWIKAKDGTRLNAWLMWPRQWGEELPAKRLASRPLVMFFQENAGNMAFRLPNLKQLTRFLDCSVFILSYRGSVVGRS